MADQSFLHWPFFDATHRDWAAQVEEVAKGLEVDHSDTDAACHALVAARRRGRQRRFAHGASTTTRRQHCDGECLALECNV